MVEIKRKRIYPCGGGTTYFAVSPEGDIYLCQRFVGIEEFKVGNVLTGWDKNLTRILLAKPVDKRERCSVCWARYFCGGECYHQAWATTRNILTPDPRICALTKCYLEISMGIYAWIYEKKGIVSEEVKSEESRHRSNTTKAKRYYQ